MVLGDSSEEAIRGFLGDLKPNFPIVKPGDERAVAEGYDVRAIPVNFVVGPDGRIRTRHEGFEGADAWDRDMLPHIPGAA